MSEKEKNVPKRRFKEFENDGAWEKLKFADVFVTLQNNTLSRAKLNSEQGIAKNVHYGDVLIQFGECLDVSKEELPLIDDEVSVLRYKTSYLQNGDIIIADTAEDETVGKCSEIVGLNNETLISGLHTIPCRPTQTFASGYLGYYINSGAYHNQLLPLMQGTKVTSISKSALRTTTVSYPKSEIEQAKIGRYFIQLDNLITLHQRKLEKMKTLKKAYLMDMFPAEGECKPKLRFAGFTDDWQQRKLGELMSYVVDNRGKNPKYYCNEGIPVIDNFMIKSNCYPNLKEATRFIDDYLFNNFIRKYNEVDDILITLVGNGIGNITLFPKGKSVIIQNTLGLRFSSNKKFMFYSLLSKNKQIISLDRGMAQPSIRQDELLDIDMELPSDIEQTKISEFFYNLDNLITLHQRKLEKLQNIKKAYLNEMFI